MRVTNGMIRNNMMLGLNKNMNKLGTLYDQMNTLKKIQRPSDDPIVLGRSLKLRLNVLETEQYQTNIGEAKSWMEISDKAIVNSHEILKEIRNLSVQASNDTLKSEDRKKILTSISQLRKQLTQESNVSYAGRNVFAGYKTDKKVLFDKDIKMDEPIKFSQEFSGENLETVSYREVDYYRVRLPYGNIDEDGLDVQVSPALALDITQVNSMDEPPQGPPVESFYHPEPGKAYLLKDTGELIINKDDYSSMLENESKIEIAYQKTHFKEGDPNPEIYFNLDKDTNTYNNKKDRQNLEYEIGIGTKLNVNTLGTDVFNPYLLRDLDEMIYILENYDTVEEQIDEESGSRHFKETISLSKLFSSGVGKADLGLRQISSQQADLGSRIKRLDFTEKRLGDDEVSFTDLLSKTENVDLEKAYVDFNTQYAVYQSALQATSRVVQPTLMDFLR